MAFNTNNPIGSTDARDLSDNAQDFDDAINDRSNLTWTDRFGVARKTVWGAFSEITYKTPVAYSSSIVFLTTEANKTVEEAGIVYAPLNSALPFTTSGTFAGDDDARFYPLQDKNRGRIFPTVAAMQAATGIQVGQRLTTNGRIAAGDGGGEDYVAEAGDSSNGVRRLLLAEGKTAVAVGAQINSSCSFIFDDQYLSAKDVAVPLFEAYGVYFGMGVYPVSVGGSGRMTAGDIIDLNARGYEIINHSWSHPLMGNSVTNQFVKAEVDTAWAWFEQNGIGVNSWLTPSSVLGTDHYEIIKQRYPFAFTLGSDLTPMKDSDPHKLWRINVDSFTEIQLKQAMDNAVIFGGSVVFYAHDFAVSDATYNKIEALLIHAAAISIPVKLPTDSVKDGVDGWTESGSVFSRGRMIDNNRLSGWTASAGATLALDSNNDLIVTATAAGSSLVQKLMTVNLDDIGVMTFSTALRELTGTLNAANSIGLKVSDADGVIVRYSIEETIGALGTNYRRYNLSGQSYGEEVKVLLFMRIDFAQSGDEALIRDPILRYGTDVLPPLPKLRRNQGFTFSPPDQTITAGGFTTENTLALTGQVDNGLFSISGNLIKFSKGAKVSISASVLADGTDTLLNSNGGAFFLDYGEDYLQSEVSNGKQIGGGSINTTLSVDGRQNVRLALCNYNADFVLKSARSKITIREIVD